MIEPPVATGGVAFSRASDGDLRNDGAARRVAASALGLTDQWATVRQVHGNTVLRVDGPGVAGEGDALWTTVAGLPLAIFTADCLGVVVHGPGAVGVAHAGWRGAAAGVVESLVTVMAGAGHPPHHAYVGPGIGPCCFEVGDDVATRFPQHLARTSWGTTSVDLRDAIESGLDGLRVWSVDGCTMHEPEWFSHRESGTTKRLAALGWI